MASFRRLLSKVDSLPLSRYMYYMMSNKVSIKVLNTLVVFFAAAPIISCVLHNTGEVDTSIVQMFSY